ncbi:MAG: glycosyltransferase family 1 protein [Bacteroidetes bacterium]|nr:glycosyltransferase family 1 protein [Bacteroidota bacterium]
MNIAVNTRLLIKDKLEGIGWFTFESLKRITTQHPEHHFYFIFDRPYANEFIFSDNITPIVLYPQARHPLLFYLWFEYSLASLLKKLKVDLFLSPDGYLSLKTDVKSLAVIHDLNFEHYPQDLPFLIRWYYQYYFPKFARKSHRIATVSEFSKLDIMNLYHIPANRIDVVYDGANEAYVPLTDDLIQTVRNKYSKGSPYFIFIGLIHPRKNLANLFRAFDLYKKKADGNVRLMVVGAKKWWTGEINAAFRGMEFANDVIFTGRLNSDELRLVLGASLALTYVSYFEGFGIPIVEAFRTHTPVITSNVTSMPEVLGDAGLLVDPLKPASIAEAMLQISQDENLRKDLIKRGEIRKELFTWQKTADRLWASIDKAIYDK